MNGDVEMKVKCTLLAVISAFAALLCGCKNGVSYQNGMAAIKNANISLSYPNDWQTFTGDDVYEDMYKSLAGDYGSAEELKKAYEDSGERLVFKAKNSGGEVFALFSEVNKGETSARQLLSAAKDELVMNVNAAGYYAESSLEDKTWGGVSGVMLSVRASEKEGEPPFLEEREFCFEREKLVFSLKIHISGGFEKEAEGVDIVENN